MHLSSLEIRDWRLKVVLTDVFFVAKGFSMQFNNEAVTWASLSLLFAQTL